MKTRLLFASLFAFACHGWAEAPANGKPVKPSALETAVSKTHDYCRFIGDDLRGKLETVVVTMKNQKGVTVDLIGAVHIADPSYYEGLNTLFKKYDALLFELVDGQNLKAQLDEEEEEEDPAPVPKKKGSNAKLTPPSTPAKPAPEAKGTKLPTKTPSVNRESKVAMSVIRLMMTSVGTYFRLQYQTEGIDYRAKNFVHADVSMAEFERLQEEKNESWAVLLQKSIEAQMKRGPKKDEEPKGSQLLLALLGDSSGIKISMARMLGQVEDSAEEIGFGSDSVIVGERNRVALEIFDREVKAGRKTLGIFYGAAHLADMEKRLESRGYQRLAEHWLTAWDIKPRVDEKK